MARGKADTNPFNSDGKGGATGNQWGGGTGFARIRNNVPPSLRQKHGSLRNPQSVAEGGPFLKLDPPSDRERMVGTTADSGQRRPFRIEGGAARDEPGEVGATDGPGTVGMEPPPDDLA